MFFTAAGWDVDRHVDELGRTLGEELLEPTRIYSLDCLALARSARERLHALSHITGGGLAENLVRVIPSNLSAVIDRSTWTPQPVFGLVESLGRVDRDELELTFNQGVGMIAVVDADAADETVQLMTDRGVRAWACGQVSAGDGSVTLTGSYGD